MRTPDAGLVSARRLSLVIKKTPVWSGLDFDFGPGLSVVCGRTGSGRSSLLLALVGRMSGVGGELRVAGLDAVHQAREVRRQTSVARVSTMINLEPQLTVAESIMERALIDSVPTDGAPHRFRLLTERLDVRYEPGALVGELDAYDQTLLAASLAELRPARVMVLDDIDAGLTVDEQRRMMRALARLPEPGAGIVVSTREAAAVPRDSALLRLPSLPRTDPLPTTDRIDS